MSGSVAEEYSRTGGNHYRAGELPEALGSFLMALALAPEHLTYRQEALTLLGVMGNVQIPDILRPILVECAADDRLDSQALAMVIHNEFHGSETLNALTQPQPEDQPDRQGSALDHLFTDDLLKAVMARAIIVTPDLEQVLTAFRRTALLTIMQGDPDNTVRGQLDFFAALALQCFNTEYAYQVNDEELQALNILEPVLSSESPLPALIIYGAYRPLFPLLTETPVDPAASDLVNLLIERLIDQPRREALLAQSITDIGTEPVNDTSRSVRDQYEQYPYPRWSNIERVEPQPFSIYLQNRFPNLKLTDLPSNGIDALIAGCGTGRQVAQVAQIYENARLTAIDLSHPSLAYARRALLDMGIDDIDFYRADILELGDWANSAEGPGAEHFDLIECMGVLHHFDEPKRGLETLTSQLKPGGFFRLGLYSERARQNVVAARRFIEDNDIPDTPDGVRLMRRLIGDLPPDDPVHSITKCQEFYSLSGLHDYIFNVMEHRFRPDGDKSIRQLIDNTGLTFLGFDHLRPDLAALYHERFPDDPDGINLTNWDQFEIDHPEMFGGMYQFWCRKAG